MQQLGGGGARYSHVFEEDSHGTIHGEGEEQDTVLIQGVYREHTVVL